MAPSTSSFSLARRFSSSRASLSLRSRSRTCSRRRTSAQSYPRTPTPWRVRGPRGATGLWARRARLFNPEAFSVSASSRSSSMRAMRSGASFRTTRSTTPQSFSSEDATKLSSHVTACGGPFASTRSRQIPHAASCVLAPTLAPSLRSRSPRAIPADPPPSRTPSRPTPAPSFARRPRAPASRAAPPRPRPRSGARSSGVGF